MKRIIFCFAIALTSCNSAEKKKEEIPVKDSVRDVVNTSTPITEITEKTAIPESGENCGRGTPESITKKGAFTKTSFSLQSNKHVGVEAIALENGDKITIKNWGCDYYALTFRFETSRFQSEPTNIAFWYKRSVTLLNELLPKLDAPIDIAKGTDRLMNRIEEEVPNGYQNLAFNEELDFQEGEIRSFVCIDKVEQLPEKRFAITITFATGPL
ncbi:MAG TPA: hypothetical protein VFF27_12435 [Bacteroidia bacterium]|jgi:hypothetical protein|nr:hypothetical protein [Bacteroidia bacterium]